jgi:hypothetical protein
MVRYGQTYSLSQAIMEDPRGSITLPGHDLYMIFFQVFFETCMKPRAFSGPASTHQDVMLL